MDLKANEFLWTEKYRPRKVKDTVLSKATKAKFQNFVDTKEIPNLLLSGKAGVGKTTAACAMLDEIGSDYVIVNGSLERNIDTLRNDITNFSTSMSLTGGRKYVILDEADHLNPQSFQPALRNFMETHSKNCGFILTCNYRNRIIPALQSRCSLQEFDIPKDEKKDLMVQCFNRVSEILKLEGVEYDAKVLATVQQKYFPDMRRLLHELQVYSATGKIDAGMLAAFTDSNVSELCKYAKAKDFANIRKWMAQNPDISPEEFYTQVYEVFADAVSPNTLPHLITNMATYSYQSAFAANQEINNLAFIVQVIQECKFK